MNIQGCTRLLPHLCRRKTPIQLLQRVARQTQAAVRAVLLALRPAAFRKRSESAGDRTAKSGSHRSRRSDRDGPASLCHSTSWISSSPSTRRYRAWFRRHQLQILQTPCEPRPQFSRQSTAASTNPSSAAAAAALSQLQPANTGSAGMAALMNLYGSVGASPRLQSQYHRR